MRYYKYTLKEVKQRVFFCLLFCSLFLQAQEDSYENKISVPVSRFWELDSQMQNGTFTLTPYRPVYLMPFRVTDNPVKQPIGTNPNREVPSWKEYQALEVKFQVSLKAKLIQDAIFGKGDLWVGFTQQAYWQMYNEYLSRVFRELNYEPELMFTYPLNFSAGNFKMRMLGISVNHQSNGKEELYSRSWNRLILLSAFEYKNMSFHFCLWKRFKENNEEDDNPDIEKYMGRGELTVGYAGKRFMAVAIIRNNLNFKRNRSRLELNLTYPIAGNLQIFMQGTYGYGDSMIDYNYKQMHFGIGFAFFNAFTKNITKYKE